MVNFGEVDKFLKMRIEDRDKKFLSPNERAEYVNTFIFMALGLEDAKDMIEQPLYFDLICYNFEMLNLFALGVEDEHLVKLMKVVSSHMYSTYYSLPDDHEMLGPSREEHTKLWQERIEAF